MTETPIPRYRCHKEVEALRIKEVHPAGDGIDLIFDPPFAPRRVTEAWIMRHAPCHGGYWVCYADGYESFSPGAAFEVGYSLIPEPPALGAATAGLGIAHASKKATRRRKAR